MRKWGLVVCVVGLAAVAGYIGYVIGGPFLAVVGAVVLGGVGAMLVYDAWTNA